MVLSLVFLLPGFCSLQNYQQINNNQCFRSTSMCYLLLLGIGRQCLLEVNTSVWGICSLVKELISENCCHYTSAYSYHHQPQHASWTVEGALFQHSAKNARIRHLGHLLLYSLLHFWHLQGSPVFLQIRKSRCQWTCVSSGGSWDLSQAFPCLSLFPGNKWRSQHFF